MPQAARPWPRCGIGVAPGVSKLKLSRQWRSERGALDVRIVSGRRLDHQFLVRRPGLDGADVLADDVAEIEPVRAAPRRCSGPRCRPSRSRRDRRPGAFGGLQRCDLIGAAGCPAGVASRGIRLGGVLFGRGSASAGIRFGGSWERYGLHPARRQIAGAFGGGDLIVMRPRHQEIALEPAVDGRKGDARPGRRAPARRTDRAQRSGDLGIVGTDAGELNRRRFGDQRSDRLRKTEGRGVDGAERRGQHVRAGALRHLGLLRHQRDQILIADRPRHQPHRQDAQAEGSVVTNSLRPFTRHNHTYAHATDAKDRYATQRNTTAGTGRHCGSNATCSFMVGLTLRTR